MRITAHPNIFSPGGRQKTAALFLFQHRSLATFSKELIVTLKWRRFNCLSWILGVILSYKWKKKSILVKTVPDIEILFVESVLKLQTKTRAQFFSLWHQQQISSPDVGERGRESRWEQTSRWHLNPWLCFWSPSFRVKQVAPCAAAKYMERQQLHQ